MPIPSIARSKAWVCACSLFWGQVRIPPGKWMFVACELSGTGLCDGSSTRSEESYQILCFVDSASLYNIVNKANLMHNFSWYVYFFSVHVSGDYVPHHQKKQLYLCDTWYLLFCMNDCLVCRVDSTSGVPRGEVWGFNPPPKFRSFDKAEPNSQLRGKYIRNCLVFLFHHAN
jgi:hypothetical protein